MQKRVAVLTFMIVLASLSACASDEKPSRDPSASPSSDLASWSGIAEALGCKYMSSPVDDEELRQKRSNCEFEDDSTFVTVVKVEDPQAAEALFTTFEQPYSFVSEMWVLVGELAILERAAKKVGSEVHGQPGEGEVTPDGGEPSSDPIMPYQKPFDFTYGTEDGDVQEWKVTLTKTECGLNEVEDADANPDWDGSDDIPEYVAAKAPEGKDFCLLHWNWENVGKIPGVMDTADDLMIGDERHAKTSEDDQRAWTLWETHLDVNYTEKINPGGSSKSLDIYTVPEGAVPDSVWFPMTTMVADAYMQVATQ